MMNTATRLGRVSSFNMYGNIMVRLDGDTRDTEFHIHAGVVSHDSPSWNDRVVVQQGDGVTRDVLGCPTAPHRWYITARRRNDR